LLCPIYSKLQTESLERVSPNWLLGNELPTEAEQPLNSTSEACLEREL
jgi:hypothetical protein